MTASAATLQGWRASPLMFIETIFHDPETGQPFQLLPAERAFLKHAFTFEDDGRLRYREWVYSCPKKCGKSTLSALAMIPMVVVVGGRFPEAFALANDQEQAAGRVYEMCRRIVEASPLLRNDAQITQYRITFPSFNATIQAIASDA